MKTKILLLIAFVISFSVTAQEADLAKAQPPKKKKGAATAEANAPAQLQHQKLSFQENDGKIFWQASLPVYITISSSPKQEGMPLKEVKTSKMEEFSKPMYFDGHGVHYLRHHDYEHNLPEQEVAYAVHVDGIAPVTKLSLDGAPKYITNGTVFFGKDLKASLNSTDEMSGVEQTYHSINSDQFEEYNGEISFDSEKTYRYFYYTADRVGNVEKANEMLFTVDTSAPSTNLEVSGDHLNTILSPRSTISLSSTDELSGVDKTIYQFDQTNELAYKSRLWVSYLADGEHQLTYRASDNVKNEETLQTYKFYLDKTAPEIASEIVGDVHEGGKYIFVSERSKVKLIASDNKAGVKDIWYQIGNEKKTYNEPFLIEGSQGTRTVKFQATDKVMNKSLMKTDNQLGSLFLDKNAPGLSHSYQGAQVFTRDTTFITSETKVKLLATDYESGVQNISYKQDSKNDNDYSTPFTISNSGLHTIEYNAKDNVNNESADNFFMVVDNDGPEVYHHTSLKAIGNMDLDSREESIPVYTHGTKLFLAAMDELVGARDIYYSVDGGKEKLYTGPIVMRQKGIRTVAVRADDKLGNETKDVSIEFVIN